MLQKHIPADGYGCRFGGDEFAIHLPDTPLDHAHEAAERLRQMISAIPIKIQGLEVHLSISVGLAGFIKDQVRIDTLFDRADKAL